MPLARPKIWHLEPDNLGVRRPHREYSGAHLRNQGRVEIGLRPLREVYPESASSTDKCGIGLDNNAEVEDGFSTAKDGDGITNWQILSEFGLKLCGRMGFWAATHYE